MPAALGERLQIRGGVAGNNATAGVDHRLVALAHHLQSLEQFVARHPAIRLVTGQIHRRIVVRHGHSLLHVLGNVDEDRAGATRAGDVKRFLEDPREILGARDQIVMFGDRPAHLDDGRLLKGVGADDAGADLAGNGEERRRIHFRVGEAGDEVGSAGAAGGDANADFAGSAGIALGRKTAALFVARQNGPQAVADAGERLVDRHAGSAGISEDRVHAVIQQALHQNVGSGLRRRGFLTHRQQLQKGSQAHQR